MEQTNLSKIAAMLKKQFIDDNPIQTVSKEIPNSAVVAKFADELADEDITSISDGLVKCLANTGTVDISYISKISNSSLDEVIEQLKGSIYLNPSKFTGNYYEGWEMKDEYLSGNLSRKLSIALEANKTYHGLFDSNIEVLKQMLKTMPYVRADDIFVTIGTPWVSPQVIETFIYHLLKIKATVTHDHKSGTWSVTSTWYKGGVLLTSTYGTRRMDALTIISHMLNQISIVVTDKHPLLKNKTIRNEKETILAVEKQKLINEEFVRWIKSSGQNKKAIETLYNERYGTNFTRIYDGSFLSMSDMNPSIHLYPYQKNAIARMILSPNTLLAGSVGSGKTYEMIGAGHETKRMKLADKILYVVPNNIVVQWKQMYYEMYPNADILVVDPKSFVPSKRLDVLNDILYNDYDGIIMAYSCFEMINLSPEQQAVKLRKQKEENEASYYNDSTRTTAVKRNHTAYMKGKLEDDIAKLGEREPGVIYFDDLGIDRLYVDEAHNFKNVPLDTNIKALGLNTSGSKQSAMMMEKVHYVQRMHGGAGVVFATGTPITNSISDIYVMQKYLQEADLVTLKLDSFNSWIGNFAERQQEFEIDVDTTSYRMASRYSKFHNLPELAGILANIADFHVMNTEQDLPQFKGYTDVVIHPDKMFEQFLNSIAKRAELIRAHRPLTLSKIDKRKSKDKDAKDSFDNMLVVTKDGRDGALDLRLFDARLPFNPESKVFRCAEEVIKEYWRTASTKGTQLIFCDTSTPKPTFNIYDEIKRLLIRANIPENEIAFIHDADTESKKRKLFESVNNGNVRILFGSTFKLGTGCNVQRLLTAIHHVDIPWRPSDMKQREGRILRPGNTNSEIKIFRYITEKSFDAYSWQLLETKQNFISKLLSSNISLRSSDDIDDTVLTYAEVKALAIGNPLIKERVELVNEIGKLKNLQYKEAESKARLAEKVAYVDENYDKWQSNIKLATLDLAHISKQHIEVIKDDELNLSNVQKDANVAQRKLLRETIFKSVVNNINSNEDILITKDYYGFQIIAPAHQISTNGDLFVFLKRNGTYHVKIGDSPSGILNRINNFLKSFDKYLENIQENFKQQCDDYKLAKIELNKEDTYSKLIFSKQAMLAQLDSQLGIKEDK